MERINNNAYRLDLLEEYGVSNTFNITDLVPFAGVADSDDDTSIDLRTNPLQEGGDDAILPRRGPSPEPWLGDSKKIGPEMQEKALGFS